MSSLAERDLERKIERLLFGSPVPPAFSHEEAGEQLKRLIAVGIHAWRVPVAGCAGRYGLAMPNPLLSGTLLNLTSVGDVNSVLRGCAYLPIRPAWMRGRTRRRDAELRGQSHFFGAEGGR
jgi:hypothetical protein